MPRRSDTRAAIVAEATKRFGADGYAATSLDDIAEAVGVRKQSLLYHFGSKDELLAHVTIAATQAFASHLDASLRAGKQGLARLEALVDGAAKFAARRPEVIAMLLEVTRLGSPISGMVTEALQPQVEAAAAWLARAMDDGTVRRQNPRVAVLTIYSAVIGYLTESVVQRAVLGKVARRTAQRELVEFLQAGLRP